MTCSLCWTSLCAACLYIYSQAWLTVYDFISVARGSVTFWWQSYACNCSIFCSCICSGSPHSVVHFLVEVLVFKGCLSQTQRTTGQIHNTCCSWVLVASAEICAICSSTMIHPLSVPESITGKTPIATSYGHQGRIHEGKTPCYWLQSSRRKIPLYQLCMFAQ